jgi:hypothetical protein
MSTPSASVCSVLLWIVTPAVVPVHPSIAIRTARAIDFTDVYDVP